MSEEDCLLLFFPLVVEKYRFPFPLFLTITSFLLTSIFKTGVLLVLLHFLLYPCPVVRGYSRENSKEDLWMTEENRSPCLSMPL